MAIQFEKIKVNQKVTFNNGRGRTGSGRVERVYRSGDRSTPFVTLNLGNGNGTTTVRPSQISPA